MSSGGPTYATGEAIRTCDRISYAGRLGRVVFVIDTRSCSAEYPGGQLFKTVAEVDQYIKEERES